jgi:hypothetical protein
VKIVKPDKSGFINLAEQLRHSLFRSYRKGDTFMRKQYFIVGSVSLAVMLALALSAVMRTSAQPRLSSMADVPQASDAAIVLPSGNNQTNGNLSGATAAITEPMISYQGKLYKDGTAYDGTLNITFRLYKVEVGGSSIWIETQSVAVEDGLFHVMLGSVIPLTWLGDDASNQLWLGIQPQGAAAELSPREPLGAVAYAFNVLPGATMVDQNPVGSYATSFSVQSVHHDAISGSSTEGYGGHFTSDSANLFALAAEAEHGAVITATNGTGLHVEAFGGGPNDWWGVASIGHVGDGFFGRSTGSTDFDTGLTARADEGRAVYAFTDGSGQFAGYFDEPIYVDGGCVGCALRFVGRNTSDLTLRPGDVVRVSGMDSPLEGLDTPVMQVALASPDQAILGVVVGRTTVEMMGSEDDSLQPGAQFGPVGGDVIAGDYLVIVVQGPVLVNIDPSSSVQPGDTVYLNSMGATLQSSPAVLGMVLSEVNSEGKVWVMIGLSR